MKTPKKSTREPVATTSAAPLEETLAKLRELLPAIFSEGKVDEDKLRTVLGDSLDDRPERYRFEWAGRRDAHRLLQIPTRATLEPRRDESVDFDNAKHVLVEGENLEVLKLLYKSYFGRIKMIYIDPPYNTGGDFIYPDNFADPLGQYLLLTGQRNSAGALTSSNIESSGRFHSNWLSMMYPRLFIARQLLGQDGVIFASIDDHEVYHLRLLMNEIFGEENFVAEIVWQHSVQGKNDVRGVSIHHNYILVYAKSAQFEMKQLPRTEEHNRNYSNPDNDPRGSWRAGDVRSPNLRDNLRHSCH